MRNLVLVALLLVISMSVGSAATVNLYGTGSSAIFAALPGGSTDNHYTVSGPGVSGTQQAVVLSSVWPGWVSDDASTSWISWTDNPYPGVYGTYTYETTIDLTGYDPGSAQLNGLWAADQDGYMLLNGGSTGVSVANGNWDAGSYPNLNAFAISSGFKSGINTLDFVVEEPDGYDGLRVRNFTLTANAVPEPAFYQMGALLALGGLGLLRSRKRR